MGLEVAPECRACWLWAEGQMKSCLLWAGAGTEDAQGPEAPSLGAGPGPWEAPGSRVTPPWVTLGSGPSTIAGHCSGCGQSAFWVPGWIMVIGVPVPEPVGSASPFTGRPSCPHPRGWSRPGERRALLPSRGPWHPEGHMAMDGPPASGPPSACPCAWEAGMGGEQRECCANK